MHNFLLLHIFTYLRSGDVQVDDQSVAIAEPNL